MPRWYNVGRMNFGGVLVASRSVKRRTSTKKKHPIVSLIAAAAIVFMVCGAGIAGVWALGTNWIGDLAEYDVADASELNTSAPTTVYASDGTTVLARFRVENQDPVSSLSDISTYVVQGTVATEDERFYEHGAIDLQGIARAAVVTLTGSGREGASTITQQLVRNTILSDEMDDISLKRKVREMYVSIKLEEAYSKDEILLMYLNTINYGNATYGIQAASQRYFSKNANELSLAEAAALIGIPQSPTNNEPINHADNCVQRRNLVLDRMLTNGYITQEEHDAAQAEPLVLNETVPTNDGILAYPYFASYVREVLQERYTQAEIFRGGMTVVTTLDIATQQAAEEALSEKEDSLNEAITGAMAAVDPDTGYVRALVGGKDYYADQTNIATGTGTDEANPGRPCGSAFKTFTLIAALEQGISPQTYVDCSSSAVIPNTEYTSSDPLENFDNTNYGTRTIERAFTVSSNTGFVRLEMAIGADKVVDVAQRMGITSPLEPYASLTLGQQNVTMLDMAVAYATIANGGTHYDAEPILSVTDSKGNVVEDNSNPEGTRVISEEVAHAAITVMRTVIESSEGTGTSAKLSNGQVAAGKTGTSTSFHDITFCGITPQMSVAIWFGDPTNVTQLPYHTNCGDVFSNFLDTILEDQPTEDFFSASDPTYTNYTNDTYHVYGSSYRSGSSSSSSSSSSGYYNSYNNGYSNSYSNSYYNYNYSNSGSGSSSSSSSSGSYSDTSTSDSSSSGTTSGGTTSGGTAGGDTTGGTTGGGTVDTGGGGSTDTGGGSTDTGGGSSGGSDSSE